MSVRLVRRSIGAVGGLYEGIRGFRVQVLGHRAYPKGPCDLLLCTWALKPLNRRYLKVQVIPIQVQGLGLGFRGFWVNGIWGWLPHLVRRRGITTPCRFVIQISGSNSDAVV